MAVMTSNKFISIAKDIAKNYKTLYVMGCFGSPLNATNKKRYTNNHAYNKRPERKQKIMNASSDTFGFDCVCLIKGILWGWNGNVNATYGGAVYGSNGVPDFGSDGIINYCAGVSSNFNNIIPGEVVHMTGHVGIYIGNGLAVECTPIWKDGVQITAVGNIGKKAGYNTRTWTNHGKLKFIDYSGVTPTPTPTPKNQYQSYDNKKKKWLPLVSMNTNEYAGNFGNAMGGIRMYGGYKLRVHLLNGSWLSWINKADNTPNGYAGIYGRSIDGVQIENAIYRVHLKGGGWLSWISKVDNTSMGYAGIYGREIDAIQIKQKV